MRDPQVTDALHQTNAMERELAQSLDGAQEVLDHQKCPVTIMMKLSQVTNAHQILQSKIFPTEIITVMEREPALILDGVKVHQDENRNDFYKTFML